MNRINALREQFLHFIIRNDTALFDSPLSEDDWQTLVTWCKAHRLTFVFMHNLKQSPDLYATLHNNELAQLAKKASRAPLRLLKIQANLLHLHKILGAHNIEYQILKGPALAFKYYQDSTLRRMRDIDIIVHPQHLSQACNVLLEHGYSFENDMENIDYDTYIESAKHAPHLTHPDFDIVVEVHHRVCRPQLTQDDVELSLLPDFWQDSDFLSIGNQSLPCGSAEILLAHIIHHSVRENAFNNGPVFIFDLYYLITHRPIRWDTFQAYCEHLHLHKEATMAFSLLRHFYPDLDVDIPFQDVPDTGLIAACKRLMLSDPEQKQYERLFSALQSKSHRDRLAHFKTLVLPTKERMSQRLGVAQPRFYGLLLPAWWLFLVKLLFSQYRERNTQTQTTKELTTLYRWLGK